MKNLGKILGALTLLGFAIPTFAASLSLTGPLSTGVQQTDQTPSIFAGATPNQPSGFGYEKFPDGGGSGATYDAYTGTNAVDWNNGGSSGNDYTVGQITTVLGGETSFYIGIDTNTTGAASEVLQLFDVLIDTGSGFTSAFSCGSATLAACGAIAPVLNNGTGFSDWLLGVVDLSAYASTDLVQFHTIITGAVDGQEQLFLVRQSEVPIPAAAWLFGTGLLGLVGIARRRKAAKATA